MRLIASSAGKPETGRNGFEKTCWSVLGKAHGARMLDDPPRRREVILLTLLFEGGLGALATGLGWLIDDPPWHVIHWNLRDSLIAVGATLPLVLIFLLCVHWPIGPLARIKTLAEEIIKPLFRPCTLFELAAISLLAGLGEEMFFRGVLQGLFSRWLEPWLALATV